MVVLATEDTVQRASMLLSSLGELALLPPDSAEVGQFEARMRAFKAKMGDLSPHSAHVDGHEHDPGGRVHWDLGLDMWFANCAVVAPGSACSTMELRKS